MRIVSFVRIAVSASIAACSYVDSRPLYAFFSVSIRIASCAATSCAAASRIALACASCAACCANNCALIRNPSRYIILSIASCVGCCVFST